MAKNILQDIVPPEKRSIRNIPIPSKNTRPTNPLSDISSRFTTPATFEIPKVPRRPVIDRAPDTVEQREEKTDVRIYPYDEEDGGGSRLSFIHNKKMLWGAGVIALLMILFAVASLRLVKKKWSEKLRELLRCTTLPIRHPSASLKTLVLKVLRASYIG